MPDRLWRSTDRSTGTQSRSTESVDRRTQACTRWPGTWAGRPGGRPDQRALLSVSGGRLGGRPGWPNGHIYDRWRSTGRSTASLSGCQISLMASFLFGLYKPQFFGILAKVFTREKLQFPQSLKQVFKSVFGLKTSNLICFRFLEKSKKRVFWEICLGFHFLSFTRVFPSFFL